MRDFPLLANDLQFLRDLLDDAPVGVVCHDPDGEVLFYNQRMAEVVGPDYRQWSIHTWGAVIHPDDFLRLQRMIEARRDLSDRQDLLRVLRPDGSWRWVIDQGHPVLDDKGELRYWLSYWVEVDKASELSERIDKALFESDVRYRALFDHSVEIMLLTSNEVIVDCNDAAVKAFGVPRSQLLGRVAFDLLADEQLPPTLTKAAHIEAYRNKLKPGMVVRSECLMRRLDGSGAIHADTSILPIQVGDESFIITTVRDVTEQRRAERQQQRTLAELAQRSQSLQWIHSASAQLFTQPSVAELAREAKALLAQHYPRARAHIGTLESDNTVSALITSRLKAHPGKVKSYPRFSVWDLVSQSPNGMLVVDDLESQLADCPEMATKMLARGVKVAVMIILYDGSREPGHLVLEYYDRTDFHADHLADLEVFARTFALALARAKHLSALEYQADHDALTGLHNRSVLHREFAGWQRNENAGATLMLFDLDRFKEINDTLGHHIGDELLREIGARLRSCLQYRSAVLCRLGGDEFAVVLLGQHIDADQACGLARDLLTELQKPFLVKGVHLEVSASVGVALYPQQGNDSHELLRLADVAMYEAKRSGAGVLLYDSRLDMHSPKRLRLIVDLNQSIREQRLLLHYQPKVDLRSGEVIGCEALVRWDHPQQGLLAPDRFIPLAEMGDTIHLLTENVIAQACSQQRQWIERGLAFSIAVNLSARNLIDDRVVRQIESLVHENVLAPEMFELEITETALMHDPAKAIAMLKRLAALGVRLSVDDFGTGYLSLSYLQRMPIHTLKIDRTFISHMPERRHDAVIVQSIITLAHNIGLKVVAEGVEDAVSLERLADMGCDQAQGYFLSKPLPAHQIQEWVTARRRLRA